MDCWEVCCSLDAGGREEFEIARRGGAGKPLGPLGPFNEIELRWQLKKLGQSNSQINGLIQRARQDAPRRELA